MSEIIADSNDTAPIGTGPGAQLLQARRDRGLDVPQVAQRLRLSVRLIEAIERDDYTGLPGTTYARGYLRAYAGLLGIAPGPVLDAYARLNGRAAPANLGKLAVAEQVTSRHQHIRLTTYLVAAVVFGLAIAWWQARESQRRSAAESAPVTALSEEPGEPQALPGALVAELPAPAAPLPAPQPKSPLAPVVSGLANLVLHADQECWVDIRDADDRRLLYETLPAGRTVSLQGVPPFSVYLGNAAAVRVEFNGEAQDISQFRRGPIARFRLGAAGGAPAAAVTP